MYPSRRDSSSFAGLRECERERDLIIQPAGERALPEERGGGEEGKDRDGGEEGRGRRNEGEGEEGWEREGVSEKDRERERRREGDQSAP